MYLILGPNPDPTILLALFHTTFNIILACIWAPWLKEVIRLDMWLFPRQKTDLHLAIEHINTTLPEEIIAAVQHDVGSLREKVMANDRASLMLDESAYAHRIDQYNEIKLIEAKLLETVISYTNYTYTKKQSKTFHLLHEAIIDLLSSRKYIKDVSHHLENLKDHSLDEEIMASSYLFFQKLVKEVTDNIHERETLSPPLDITDLQ